VVAGRCLVGGGKVARRVADQPRGAAVHMGGRKRREDG